MNDAVKTSGRPSPVHVGTDAQASVWLALKLGPNGVADVAESLVRSPQLVADHTVTLDRLEKLVRLLHKALPELRAMDREASSERLYLIGPEIDAPETEYERRYKTGWSRRVLQRSGVEAPTAEEVDLLIREAKLLDEAMTRYVWAVLGACRGDPSVAFAAAVTAYYCGHAHEFGWLEDVADAVRLEEELYNDLGGEEEQRRYSTMMDAESYADTEAKVIDKGTS